MRFDDMIATVLGGLTAGAMPAASAWRQLVDLVAQGRTGDRLDDALHAIDMLRDEVAPDDRAAIALSLGRRAVSPLLVEIFAADRPAIAAPLLSSIRLTDEDWIALLPRLGPSHRALLRHRRDLGKQVERALAGFGQFDLIVGSDDFRPIVADAAPSQERPAAAVSRTVEIEAADFDDEPAGFERDAPASSEQSAWVPNEAAPLRVDQPADPAHETPEEAEANGAQIQDLLRRIDGFRQRQDQQQPAFSVLAEEGFSFETDAAGFIVWIEGVPRGPLIGATIALPAETGEHGVDGQAAGAFRRRAPFRNARLVVAGNSAAGGDWRISGVPFFERQSGRFSGYRGSARRPRRDEVAADGGAPGALFGSSLSPDSLRQLVHELRTPLNAIQGFADMIEGQMLGPAATGYRARASEIAGQARRLMGAVDDLDVAARIEINPRGDAGGHSDGVALLCRLHAEYLPVARENEVELRFRLAERLPMLLVPAAAAERMFARLLGATIAMARRDDVVTTSFGPDPSVPGMLRLTLSRPAALAGLEEPDLLDPGYSPAGDWPEAPVLGLGFALRLVSNLARAHGGRLLMPADSFVLTLPAATEAIAGDRQSG